MKEGNLGIKSITEEEQRYSTVSSSGVWLLKDLKTLKAIQNLTQFNF